MLYQKSKHPVMFYNIYQFPRAQNIHTLVGMYIVQRMILNIQCATCRTPLLQHSKYCRYVITPRTWRAVSAHNLRNVNSTYCTYILVYMNVHFAKFSNYILFSVFISFFVFHSICNCEQTAMFSIHRKKRKHRRGFLTVWYHLFSKHSAS